MSEPDDPTRTVNLTAEIVVAFLTKNAVGIKELPQLILEVYNALETTANGPSQPELKPLTPAVPVRRSVTPDQIVCLECGKGYKSLKRHLSSHHELTPDDYRQRWRLPANYPIVAPNYSHTRSDIAKHLGLGQQRQKIEVPSQASQKAPATKKTSRRKPKTAEPVG